MSNNNKETLKTWTVDLYLWNSKRKEGKKIISHVCHAWITSIDSTSTHHFLFFFLTCLVRDRHATIFFSAFVHMETISCSRLPLEAKKKVSHYGRKGKKKKRRQANEMFPRRVTLALYTRTINTKKRSSIKH